GGRAVQAELLGKDELVHGRQSPPAVLARNLQAEETGATQLAIERRREAAFQAARSRWIVADRAGAGQEAGNFRSEPFLFRAESEVQAQPPHGTIVPFRIVPVPRPRCHRLAATSAGGSVFYAQRGSVPRQRHTQHRAPDGSLYAEELFGVE